MRTKLSHFNFDLPKKLIAQYPTENRDESRLMVVHRDSGKIEHKVFKDVINYFDEDDTFIFNNTKVFPARLYGKKEKTGANIEVFLLRELKKETRLWDVLVDPARKIRVGNKLYFSDDDGNDLLIAEVVDNTTSRGRTIRFLYDGTDAEFHQELAKLGNTPLPKYIVRPKKKIVGSQTLEDKIINQADVAPPYTEMDIADFDRERYQTVYAKNPGAVAAPTAGLHFSRELLKRFELKGIHRAEVTLHVGLGTFRGIEVEDLSKHKMDAEYYQITDEASDLVNTAIKNKKRICGVGTTSMRTIESAVSANGTLKTSEGWTNLFIYPPYDFEIPNAMITNFHLPKSSLVIMTAAFGGTELIMEAYQQAVKEEYRFYSYGDAMLIL